MVGPYRRGMGEEPVSQREQDAGRARLWGMAVLVKTEGFPAREQDRYVFEGGVRVDRWERVRTACAWLMLAEMDADLGRLAVAAAACRAGYDYCRATEAPTENHEAYRIGAEVADAALGFGWEMGLRLDSGRAARDAVLAEIDAPGYGGSVLRSRRPPDP